MKLDDEFILDGNRIITTFFKDELSDIFPPIDTHLYFIKRKIFNQWNKNNVLQYHISWELIMCVIEKIDNLYHKGFPIMVSIGTHGANISINRTNAGGNIYEGRCEIANTLNINYFNDYPEADRYTKKEGVWLAIVKFIKWYNVNKE